MSGCRMDDESRLFVDDEDMLVLVKDMERNGFGQIISWLGLWYAALDAISGFGAVTRLFRLFVNQYLMTAD